MLDAPIDAVFVWCNNVLDYPMELAKHLKRDDIQVVAPRFLSTPDRWVGKAVTGVVLDHAAWLDGSQKTGLKRLRQQIRSEL